MIWIALRLYLALQTNSPESNSSPILVDNVRQMAPSLDVATAKLHVAHARAAALMADVEPELLLAMAYVESRYDVTAESVVRGQHFCGVLQTIAGGDALTCLVMRDLGVGYLAGAIELRTWLKVTHGDLAGALNGHGCGYYGLAHGCRHYAERVLARSARLKTSTKS